MIGVYRIVQLEKEKKKDENETAFHALQEIIRRDAERDGIQLPPDTPEEKNPPRLPPVVKAVRKADPPGLRHSRRENAGQSQRKQPKPAGIRLSRLSS